MIPALLPLALLSFQPVQDPGTSYHFRVWETDPARLAALEQRFDTGCGGHNQDGSLDVIVPPEEVGAFQALKLASVTLVARGRPFHQIRAEQRQGPLAGGPDVNYYTVAEIDQLFTNLETQYPGLCRKINVTQLVGGPLTHDGNSITALKISDNAAVMEDEPAVLIVAQHHARELNSTHIVIGAAQRILQSYATDPAIRQIVDGQELWLIPCINPDGTNWVWNVDNNWRKNRRSNGGSFGVDNNRNYSFYWSSATCGGSTATSNDTYRGPSALSEPENQVLDRLGARLRPEKYLDFHSSGREVLNTYNACAREPANAMTLLNFYRDDLRNPMTYGFRDPSASGEAPEHHWVQSGTLSFLTEISTAFQPVWSATVAEEARVWPGLRRALDWKPALRGHVRAICGSTPIAAEILVSQMGFIDGERNFAEASFGRYKAWMPPGTFTVTFRAAGYQDFTTNVTVGAFNVTQTLDVFLVPTGAPATLTRSGSGQIGTQVQLTYTSPGDAGRDYWVPMALGSSPGITLGTRTLPINGDAIFTASLNLFPVLVNNLGTLPGGAVATAQFNIPPIAELVGFTFFFDGITFDPSCQFGVKTFSPSLSVAILP